MSTLKVEVVKIDAVEAHPNADRLELAHVKGWQCVAQKGKFKAGDYAIYFPIDSVLPEPIEMALFPPDSKVKLEKSRVRTIKLRGAISQGLLCLPSDFGAQGKLRMQLVYSKEGDDLTELLGVTKYEPPLKAQLRGAPQTNWRRTNPYFNKYTDIENFKNYPNLFAPDDMVVVLEKIHGTNFRAGYVPFHAATLWQKVRKFFRMAPQWQFVYGSHRVQLQDKWSKYKGWHSEHGNVYCDAVEKYHLRDAIDFNYVVYGEIYGDGIQKGYNYGLPAGVRKLVVFDIKHGDKYLDHEDVVKLCDAWGLEHAPVEYVGLFQSRELMKTYVDGPSSLSREQKLREGIVIKPLKETICYMGRKILKFKSDEFLLKVEDDTH